MINKIITSGLILFAFAAQSVAQEKMYVWQQGTATEFYVAEIDSINFIGTTQGGGGGNAEGEYEKIITVRVFEFWGRNDGAIYIVNEDGIYDKIPLEQSWNAETRIKNSVTITKALNSITKQGYTLFSDTTSVNLNPENTSYTTIYSTYIFKKNN